MQFAIPAIFTLLLLGSHAAAEPVDFARVVFHATGRRSTRAASGSTCGERHFKGAIPDRHSFQALQQAKPSSG